MNPSRPLLRANSRKIKLKETCIPHLDWLSQLPLGRLKYTHIRKFRKLAERFLRCECIGECIRTLCYLKVHAQVYPKSRKFCIYIFRNFLVPDGQKKYEELIDTDQGMMPWRWSRTLSGFFGELNPLEILSQCPPVSCLPLCWFPKPSKLYLSRLPLPTEEQCNSFRSYATRFLRQYMPRSLYLPDDKEALSYGSKKYASAGTIKRDYEAGEWDSPLIYVRLLTQNTSIRETFVPSKAYKFASTYWHPWYSVS